MDALMGINTTKEEEEKMLLQRLNRGNEDIRVKVCPAIVDRSRKNVDLF